MDSQHYQMLKDWIDSKMPPFYENLPPSILVGPLPRHPNLFPKHRHILPSFASKIVPLKWPRPSNIHKAWQRPPVDIEYSLKNSLDFPALGNNKIDDTKSTASSTPLAVSGDYKSLIGKELAQFKEEAITARSELKHGFLCGKHHNISLHVFSSSTMSAMLFFHNPTLELFVNRILRCKQIALQTTVSGILLA
jgi:hypothetical protein